MNQEDYKNQIDKWLQSVDSWTTKKIWQVISALNSAWQLEGQDSFRIPLEKFARARSISREDLVSILSNLHRREIIQVIKKLGETAPSGDPDKPKASIWITIIEKPDIINQADTQIRIIAKKFAYLVEKLKIFVTKDKTQTQSSEKINDEVQDKIVSSIQTIKQPEWRDSFEWKKDKFIFGNYGSIIFESNERKDLFERLTNKKGGWVKVTDLKGNKDEKYVRSTISQIEKKMNPELKKHVSIPSTKNDDLAGKPEAQGAYRIKFSAKP